MANENLGDLNCGGCDGVAHVRQQKTGKKLLYLYCPNCGMDKRSGAKLQTKWQAAIDGISLDVIPKAKPIEKEWQDKSLDKEEKQDEEREQRNDNGNSGNSGKIFAGLGILGIIGLVWKATRI